MDVRAVIIKQFNETLNMTGGAKDIGLVDDTVLLESGLDSLGFAILVTRLEQVFGCDPFTMVETPVYPRTFKEFVGFYEQHIK